MRQLLGYSDNRATEFNFTVLYIWRGIMRSKVCRAGDLCVVKFNPKGAMAPMYLFPAGRGTEQQLKLLLEECMADAREMAFHSIWHRCSVSRKKFLNLFFPTDSRLNLQGIILTISILQKTLHSLKAKSSRAREISSHGSRSRRGGAMNLSGRTI